MTVWDKGLIFSLIILSLLGIFFVKTLSVNSGQTYLLIDVDGKPYKKISLDSSSIHNRIEVETPFGHNIVEIDGNQAKIVESDCRDQICVKTGWISKDNQTSICLPNRVSIRIESNQSDIDGISY
ncbi:MAG: NusG domain II-containing protein [Bacillota bacterium]